MNIRPKVLTGPPVSLRLPDALYDGLCRVALRRDMPLSELMRELLALGLRIHGVSQTNKRAPVGPH
jgi:predicted DNA-binding ribbon-helix-helix protein